MPKRTREAAQETRRQLLAAALDEFHEKGFNATSLNHIALRAGYTRGAVYWHFENKNDLFLALSEQMNTYFDESMDSIHYNASPSIQTIRATATHYLHLCLRDPLYRKYHEVLLFGFEWAQAFEDLRTYIIQRRGVYIGWVAETLTVLQEQGQLRPQVDVPGTALAVYAMVEGLTSLYLSQTQERDAFELMDSILDPLFDSILEDEEIR